MANFTKKALAEATRELLQEKEIHKITVKEITEKCGLTRNTFYYHFNDIYDVVNWIIVDEADSIFNHFPNAEQWELAFKEGLSFLYNNKMMVVHIYKSVTHLNLEHYVRSVISNYVHKLLDILVGSDYDEKAKAIATNFYLNGFVGMVMQWVEDDMRTSPEYMATLCNVMLKGTFESIIKSAEKTIEIIGNK